MSLNYFLDTEFNEDGETIDLISIALVCEDDREYYAINRNCRIDYFSDWVQENVFPLLPPKEPSAPINFKLTPQQRYKNHAWKPSKAIAEDIFDFVGGKRDEKGNRLPLEDKPIFWGYYCATDWVALYRLYGRMIDLPKGYPWYCRDIKQECDRLGNPSLPPKLKQHDALEDARWIRESHDFLARCKFTHRSKNLRNDLLI